MKIGSLSLELDMQKLNPKDTPKLIKPWPFVARRLGH